MNAYEYAMQVEKDGEKYYRELAEKSPYTGLKRVFTILADEEVKHYKIFKDLMEHNTVDINKLDIITDKKTIFAILSEDKDKINFNADQIQFYKEAIAREDGLEQFYLRKAQELESDIEKEVFIKISKEEAKHKIFLENVITFLQEQSNLAVSAEF